MTMTDLNISDDKVRKYCSVNVYSEQMTVHYTFLLFLLFDR